MPNYARLVTVPLVHNAKMLDITDALDKLPVIAIALGRLPTMINWISSFWQHFFPLFASLKKLNQENYCCDYGQFKRIHRPQNMNLNH